MAIRTCWSGGLRVACRAKRIDGERAQHIEMNTDGSESQPNNGKIIESHQLLYRSENQLIKTSSHIKTYQIYFKWCINEYVTFSNMEAILRKTKEASVGQFLYQESPSVKKFSLLMMICWSTSI